MCNIIDFMELESNKSGTTSIMQFFSAIREQNFFSAIQKQFFSAIQ